MRPIRLRLTVTLMAFLLAACGGEKKKSPVQPPPPPPEFQLACPAPLEREASSPDGTDVHFDAPQPQGGRPPYEVACDPGSGSVFPIGESSARCTAKDSENREVSCTFGVRVSVSQRLTKTRFLAFGDSITEGAVTLVPLLTLATLETYPFKLEELLSQRYPSQTFVVVNAGKGGEDTREGAIRLPNELETHQPEVVLLHEGVNKINPLRTSVQVEALRTMIVEAQRRKVDVIIATLLPMLPSPTNRVYQSTTPGKIAELNGEIYDLAAQYDLGSPVDLHAIFMADLSLMGSDGLHPSAAGQTRIAEAFRDAIIQRYHMPSTTSSSLRMRSRR